MRRLRLVGLCGAAAACTLVLPLSSPARPMLSPSAPARVLETVTIPNLGGQAVTTSALEEDHRYRITASGTVSDWCPATATKPEDCSFGSPLEIAQGVDALYCYAAWRCATPQLWRQLRFNGVGLDQLAGKEIPYSTSHSYTVEVEDLSGPLTLHSTDGGTDNSGAFTVTISDLGPKNCLKVRRRSFSSAAQEPQCVQPFDVAWTLAVKGEPNVKGSRYSANLAGARMNGGGAVRIVATSEAFEGSHFHNDQKRTEQGRATYRGLVVVGPDLVLALAPVRGAIVYHESKGLRGLNFPVRVVRVRGASGARCDAGVRGTLALSASRRGDDVRLVVPYCGLNQGWRSSRKVDVEVRFRRVPRNG